MCYRILIATKEEKRRCSNNNNLIFSNICRSSHTAGRPAEVQERVPKSPKHQHGRQVSCGRKYKHFARPLAHDLYFSSTVRCCKNRLTLNSNINSGHRSL